MIDILIPVLGRPQNAQPLVDSITENTRVDHAIWFVCSATDTAQIEACSLTGHIVLTRSEPPGPGDYAKKINQAFRSSARDWVFVGADDISFEPRWDIIALKKAGDWHDVVATNDLANRQVQAGIFGTHNLVRRRYVTEQGATAEHIPGVLLHEGYDHNYVDRELCHVAQAQGRYVFARHSRVRHLHPLWRTAPSDPTYIKALANGRQDQLLFLQRAHLWNYVGLTSNERKAAA